MATIYDVPTQELIEMAAVKLKAVSEVKPPVWAAYAKTGQSKERPPQRDDWWYVRSASVLRAVYRLGPVGVSKLRTKYGGRKNNGVAGEHTYKASGNILRKILQQLEKAQLVRQMTKDVRKGRIITPKGKSLLDKTATEIYKGMPHEKVMMVEVKAEKKVKEPKEVKEVKEIKEEKKA